MPPEQVQTLNYCAHAIEALHELHRNLHHVAPDSAQVCRCLIDKLRQSVKFILPNGCHLIDPQEFRQAHLDLIRLPFPCVAFEAPWETEHPVEQLGEFTQWRATKRIALCWASADGALFLSEDSVLRSLGDSEFDDAFGRNLDFLARLRIATDARFAVGELEFSEAGDGKDVFRLAIGQSGELVEKLYHRSFGKRRFLSEMLGDL